MTKRLAVCALVAGTVVPVFHPARYENVTVAVDVRTTPVLGCAV